MPKMSTRKHHAAENGIFTKCKDIFSIWFDNLMSFLGQAETMIKLIRLYRGRRDAQDDKGNIPLYYTIKNGK